MTRPQDQAIAIGAIRGAIPYLRLFQGRTFVIKAGGEVFADEFSTNILMEQVGVLHQLGIRVVLVHGGGNQTSDLAKALGLPTKMVDGRRVTDRETRDVSTMVLNGSVNTAIVAACRKLGIPALGISGVDAGLIQAKRRPPREMKGHGLVDFGYVGDIESVQPRVLERLLEDGIVPIVSPLSADKAGSVLNINADVVASKLAIALGAEKFILITCAPGIMTNLSDPTSMISLIDVDSLSRMIDAGQIQGGMLPKVDSIQAALQGGVPRVHVIHGRNPDALLMEVFTNEGSGTLVVGDMDDLKPEEADAALQPSVAQ